jgi:hypothetical protein
VRIFLGARGAGLPPAPSATILGPVNNTHTGLSLSCADVDGDGHADLAIGSHYAFTSTTQSGRLDVFLASAAQPAFLPGAATTLDAADYSWRGEGLGEWFGYSSAAAGTGSAGATDDEVAELLLRSAANAGVNEAARGACVREAADAVVAQRAAPGGASLLVVGQPGFKAVAPGGGPGAVGRVSGFAIPQGGSRGAVLAACLSRRGGAGPRAPLSPAALFTITADASILNGPLISSKLGHGVALGSPRGAGNGTVLALGMAAVDFCNSSSLVPGNASQYNTSAGSVTVLTVGPALRGDLLFSDVAGRLAGELRTTVLGSALPESRFGWRVKFADVDDDGADDLLVSAPMRTPLFIGGAAPCNDSGHEAGAVFAFRGGATFPFAGAPVGVAGSVACGAAASAWLELQGQGEFGRFGEATLLARFDGAAPRLLVSAPRVTEILPPQARADGDDPSATVEMPGAVYVRAQRDRTCAQCLGTDPLTFLSSSGLCTPVID